MLRRSAVTLVLGLSACSQTPQTGGNQATADEKVVEANVSGNVAGVSVEPANGSAEGNESGALPPANAELRFVGTWAKSHAECASKPWKFTADALDAAGGPHCSLYKVTKAPGGYDLAAECPAKQPVHTDLIRLRFAESAGGMLVESNAIPPTGLIFCGK